MRAEDDRCLEGMLAREAGLKRVLVVVAHPDDEVLGCSAVLSRNPGIRVIHVTDGAPRDGGDARRHGFETASAYAAARAREAREALACAGLPAEALSCLGLPDQEASCHLAATARHLAPDLTRVDLVLTHAFEGGHGDHDAVAFAVHAAARLIPVPPVLVEMPFYHADRQGWARQRFLPQAMAGVEHVIGLGPEQRAVKAGMIAAHRSQGDTLRDFDLGTERFRVAPRYDFTTRPHGGALLYERHGWQLDWPLWLARVGAAEADLARDRAA